MDDWSGGLGCGCLGGLALLTGAMAWGVSGTLGLWQALWVGLVINLTIWGLAVMGIIPVLGQWLYKLFAEKIILWVCSLLQVNPNLPMVVPAWINMILDWFLDANAMTGTLYSYSYFTGFWMGIMVSIIVAIFLAVAIWNKFRWG